ncbi:MAG: hypothetical protein CGW95_16720 [Phenylobacterium zucineum]|nr:MAG: hypothetical protein CGW95_16720 [Phenylobacterium zucineum]
MTQYESETRSESKNTWATVGLVALFTLPSTTGIIGRLAKGGHWFADFEAMACAGQRALAGRAMYDLNLSCPGMQATPYVYPPATAHLLAAMQRAIDFTATAAVYGALYWLAAGFLLATSLWGIRAKGSLSDRAPYLALISGSALSWGNVAVVVHGAVAAAALLVSANLWVLSLVIAASAMIKPVFLTYIVILLLARQPLWKRLAASGVSVMVGLAPTVWFVLTDPGTAEAWRSVLTHFLVDAHGVSFFGWVSLLGMDIRNSLVIPAYLVFAAAIMAAGLVICEAHDLDTLSRAWIGMTAATLLNPRLMSQDLLVLGPGIIALIAAAGGVRPGSELMLRRMTIGICGLTLVLTVAGGRLGQTLATLGLSANFLWIGTLHLTTVRQNAKNIFLRYGLISPG